MAIFKPKETSEEANPISYRSWTSKLQNCEKLNSVPKVIHSVVFLYGSPSKLIQEVLYFLKSSNNWPYFKFHFLYLDMFLERQGFYELLILFMKYVTLNYSIFFFTK